MWIIISTQVDCTSHIYAPAKAEEGLQSLSFLVHVSAIACKQCMVQFMYVYVYVYVCLYAYVYLYACTKDFDVQIGAYYACERVPVYVCMHACFHVQIDNVPTRTNSDNQLSWSYKHMHACMCVCTMCACIDLVTTHCIVRPRIRKYAQIRRQICILHTIAWCIVHYIVEYAVLPAYFCVF
jgi:hypothetical protein